MSGAYGKDIIIEVPLGTVGKNEETGEVEVENLSSQALSLIINGTEMTVAAQATEVVR